MKLLPYLLAAGVALSASPALATGKMSCNAGPQKGWKVSKSKVDGGCYEVYGTDPKGNKVEAYFHPVTLEKLLVSRRGEVLFKKK